MGFQNDDYNEPSANPRPKIPLSYGEGVRPLNTTNDFEMEGVIDNGACYYVESGESETYGKYSNPGGIPGNVLGL
jgi:hypothetical protein